MMEITKQDLDNFYEYMLQREYDRRREECGVLKQLYEIHNPLKSLQMTTHIELGELVNEGMELLAKGYKMRQELVYEDGKYFIVFERN